MTTLYVLFEMIFHELMKWQKCAGGSIPVTLTFQEATQKNVLHLPMGSSDDGAHSQNEKIDERNFMEGRKVLAAYLHELGKL